VGRAHSRRQRANLFADRCDRRAHNDFTGTFGSRAQNADITESGNSVQVT